MKPQTFGSTTVHKVAEIDRLALDCDWLFPSIDPEVVDRNRDWLGATFVEPGTRRLYMSFHSYVIQTPTLNILLDTCNGNHKQRPSMPDWHMLELPYLEKLAAIGLRPEDIDIVMCTHLHADHVGWNTKLENGRWVPTFPKARYVMSRAEYKHYEGLHRAGPAQPVTRGAFADSVLPIIEHDRAELLDAGDTIDERVSREIALEAAPGHSPAGLNLLLNAGGRRACFCGDVIHHAVQFAVPDLSNLADHDPAQAVATRRRVLDRSADDGSLLMTGHFPDPTVGRVVRHGELYRFKFEG
jgi:glyoxylase-like metal-dependent hydrolase (beta-lactamase superfamily II)